MPRSGAQPRKAVTLSRSLQREVSMYALAASAAGMGMLSLSPSAAAQIVYTPTHKTIVSGGKMLIDLNNDGIPDLTLREFSCSAGTYFPANSLQVMPRAGGGVVFYLGAAALRPGAQIGPSANFLGVELLMENATNYGVYQSGPWEYTPKNHYLGVKFQIEGETHYGWARLNVAYTFEGKDIDGVLTGYAYQSKADTLILAGDEGRSGDDAGAASGATSVDSEVKPEATLGALALGHARSGSAKLLPRCPF